MVFTVICEVSDYNTETSKHLLLARLTKVLNNILVKRGAKEGGVEQRIIDPGSRSN